MRNLLKLLISPIDAQEAQEVVLGGADIVDVKNPKEGPLGAGFPWVIRQIQKVTPQSVELSCTIGDVPNLPGTAALAALGAASLGVKYVKVGLLELKTQKDTVYLMQNVAKAVKGYDSKVKVVVAGYADAQRVGSVNPMLIPQIAMEADCDFAMLDTAVKDGKSLFDFLTVEQLQKFVDSAHEYGLGAALAGSLRKQDLPVIYGLGTDIAGVRGAACTNSNRITGRITKEKVRELVEIVRQASSEKRF